MPLKYNPLLSLGLDDYSLDTVAGDLRYLKLDQTTAQTITNDSPIFNTLTGSKVVFTTSAKKLTSTGIGTSSQFIKGDGSLDSSTYLTAEVDTLNTVCGRGASYTANNVTLLGITIGANTLTTSEWAYLDGQDQSVFTTSSPQFANLVITAGGDIKPSANSTTAINIAQADGTNFISFDTTNKRMGIGGTPTAPMETFNAVVDGVFGSYGVGWRLTKTGSTVVGMYQDINGTDGPCGTIMRRGTSANAAWLIGLNNSDFLRIANMASANQTGVTNAKDGTAGITINTNENVIIGNNGALIYTAVPASLQNVQIYTRPGIGTSVELQYGPGVFANFEFEGYHLAIRNRTASVGDIIFYVQDTWEGGRFNAGGNLYLENSLYIKNDFGLFYVGRTTDNGSGAKIQFEGTSAGMSVRSDNQVQNAISVLCMADFMVDQYNDRVRLSLGNTNMSQCACSLFFYGDGLGGPYPVHEAKWELGSDFAMTGEQSYFLYDSKNSHLAWLYDASRRFRLCYDSEQNGDALILYWDTAPNYMGFGCRATTTGITAFVATTSDKFYWGYGAPSIGYNNIMTLDTNTGVLDVTTGFSVGGTAAVADGTYTVGAALTPGGNTGQITTKGGIITAVQQAT